MDVRQTILETDSEGISQIRMEIEPRSLVEDGVRVRPPSRTTLDLEVDRSGTVSRIVRAAHLSETALQALEIDGLLKELLPPLPDRKVALGDAWTANLTVEGRSSKVDLRGTGRLTGFRTDKRRLLAALEIRRRGTLTTRQRVGRVDSQLEGNLRSSTEAKVDIDNGILVSSVSRSVSTFSIGTGRGPAGAASIEIETRIELI